MNSASLIARGGSDVTGVSGNWQSTYLQVQDASTDLNVDSGTLFVD